MTGKHHSEETKKKMRLALIGNKSNLGKHHSEETKKKISESIKQSRCRSLGAGQPSGDIRPGGVEPP